jgi:hypothetical protein
MKVWKSRLDYFYIIPQNETNVNLKLIKILNFCYGNMKFTSERLKLTFFYMLLCWFMNASHQQISVDFCELNISIYNINEELRTQLKALLFQRFI